MVSLEEVRASNAALRNRDPGQVVVVTGATSGIGEATLLQLAQYLNSPTVYFVGRNTKAGQTLLAKLRDLSPGANFCFIQEDVSILGGVDEVCNKIKEKESKIDVLFLSAGVLYFGEKQENSDGLDTMYALRYYNRLRFIYNLMPLLRQTSSRVVSVLDAGKEGSLIEADLWLKTHHTTQNVIGHSNTMTVLAMEHLAMANDSVSFLHVFPGFVKTNLVSRDYGLVLSTVLNVTRNLLSLWAVPLEESGERHLFCSTSDRFCSKRTANEMENSSRTMEAALGTNGEKGSGVYSLGWDGEKVGNLKLLAEYRVRGMAETVWKHTLETFTLIESRAQR